MASNSDLFVLAALQTAVGFSINNFFSTLTGDDTESRKKSKWNWTNANLYLSGEEATLVTPTALQWDQSANLGLDLFKQNPPPTENRIYQLGWDCCLFLFQPCFCRTLKICQIIFKVLDSSWTWGGSWRKKEVVLTLDPLLCIFLPPNGMSHFIKYFAKRVLFHVIHWMNVFFLGSTQMNQPHTESVTCYHINVALFWTSWRLRACFWWKGAAITRCFLFTIACKHFRGRLGDD